MKFCSANTIVYLTRSNEGETRQLIRSLRLVAKNILPWSPADIWVFHENDFDRARLLKEPIVAQLGVKLAEVDFSSIPVGMENLPANKRGYRHMCHFFANDIFHRDELQPYDYQMRLDVDSYILSPVKFNICEMMSKKGVRYVYRLILKESKGVSHGLLKVSEEYFKLHPEIDRLKKPLSRVNLYYNNFEVCDLRWFRDKLWQMYFNAIDAAGGIYSNRWGDAPIRWIGLQHLLEKRETYCLREMAYFHAFKLEKWFAFRMPWEYLRYSFSVLKWMVMSSQQLKQSVSHGR